VHWYFSKRQQNTHQNTDQSLANWPLHSRAVFPHSWICRLHT